MRRQFETATKSGPEKSLLAAVEEYEPTNLMPHWMCDPCVVHGYLKVYTYVAMRVKQYSQFFDIFGM